MSSSLPTGTPTPPPIQLPSTVYSYELDQKGDQYWMLAPGLTIAGVAALGDQTLVWVPAAEAAAIGAAMAPLAIVVTIVGGVFILCAVSSTLPISAEQERAQTMAIPAPKPPSKSKMVAVVEDDALWTEITPEIILGVAAKLGLGVDIRVFPTCELLLAGMAGGQRFALYIVDNDLKQAGGILRGPACVVKIRSLQPKAIIIGFSADFDDPGFVAQGASGFISKATQVAQDFVNVLRQLK